MQTAHISSCRAKKGCQAKYLISFHIQVFACNITISPMQMTVDDNCHLSVYGALNEQRLPRGEFKNNFYSTSD